MEAGPSSPLGFHNIPARSREEREAEKCKTDFEKRRIAARNNRGEAPPGEIIKAREDSSLYIDEHSRFAAPDAATLEHARRQQMIQKKEAMLEQKRTESYHRAEKYWSTNVRAVEKDEARMTMKRTAGEGGTRRNKSSACYNILTLDYEQSPQGQALQYKDETVQFKAALRAHNLYSKANSVSHNIITGQPLQRPTLPERPIPPWEK